MSSHDQQGGKEEEEEEGWLWLSAPWLAACSIGPVFAPARRAHFLLPPASPLIRRRQVGSPKRDQVGDEQEGRAREERKVSRLSL